MIDTCACNNTMTYKKAIPSEIIELGDIVMLDPGTNYIKRAVANDFGDLMINSRLIVGVCVKSNNTASIPDMLDGGSSEELDRELIDSGRTGYLIKNRNNRAYIQKIEDLMDDLDTRKRIGKESRKEVKKYDGKEVIKHWLQIMKEK